MRVRAWVIGVAFLITGFAIHAIFEVQVAQYAGRIEMGQFACIEAMLFAVGLGITVLSLAYQPPCAEGKKYLAGWYLWVAAALAALLAVLHRLPP